MKFRFLAFFCAAIVISSCSTNKPPEKTGYMAYKGGTQGTFFEIQYKDTLDYRADVDLILKQIDEGFNLWDSTSVISRLNKWEDTKKVFSFEDSMLNFSVMMDASRDIYEKTKGAFDPTVLPVLKLWNFGKEISVEPSQEQIDSVLEYVGFTEFDFMMFDNPYEDSFDKPTQIRKIDPNSKLDFNGIVQGYTSDLIGDMLESKGVEHFMINIGGELKLKGNGPGGDKWLTGIQDPRKEGEKSESVIQVTDCGVATSGSYRKFKMIDGIRHSHTIDGRIGRPVTHSLLSVTVVSPSAYEADAYATAFMVMGTNEIHAFLRENPELGLEVYLIEDFDGELHVTHTPDFPLLK